MKRTIVICASISLAMSLVGGLIAGAFLMWMKSAHGDWLGFAGGVLGGGATIIAGIVAWKAAMRTIGFSQRQWAIERLLKQAAIFMKFNRLRASARTQFEANRGSMILGAPVKEIVDYRGTIEAISAFSEMMLAGEREALRTFDALSVAAVVPSKLAYLPDRANTVADALFHELMGSIEARIDALLQGHSVETVGTLSLILMDQYEQHMKDGSRIDISHLVGPAKTIIMKDGPDAPASAT